MKTTVTITIDTDTLSGVTDQYLASLWHVAQTNPVDGFENKEAGELAEQIGREIIRRFLATTPPELWAHQASHYQFNKTVLQRPTLDADAILGKKGEQA